MALRALEAGSGTVEDTTIATMTAQPTSAAALCSKGCEPAGGLAPDVPHQDEVQDGVEVERDAVHPGGAP